MGAFDKAKETLDGLAVRARPKEDDDDLVIYVDAEPNNADWLRSISWDLFVPDGDTMRLVTTAEDFMFVLGMRGESEAKQKAAVADFMKLPAARPMPQELKDDLKKHGLL